jgi:hypothetical protein
MERRDRYTRPGGDRFFDVDGVNRSSSRVSLYCMVAYFRNRSRTSALVRGVGRRASDAVVDGVEGGNESGTDESGDPVSDLVDLASSS